MLLELAEVLDCPDCRAAAGLVAFVERAEARRVVEGWLGCPLCEVEVPVRGGTMRFDRSPLAPRTSGSDEPPAPPKSERTPEARSAPAAARPPAPASEAALRIAALLGVTDRAGAVVLLGPRVAEHAARLARLGDRLEVLAWLDGAHEPVASPQADLAAGVNPLRGAAPGGWPVRSGSLHGIALAGPLALDLAEAERCLRPGARLTVARPAPEDIEALLGSGLAELAADATAWVGRRP